METEITPLESINSVPLEAPVRKRLAVLKEDLKHIKRAAKQLDPLKLKLMLVCAECESLVTVKDWDGGVLLECNCSTREVI